MLIRLVPLVGALVLGSLVMAEVALTFFAPSIFRGLAVIPLALTRTFRLPPRTIAREESGYRDPAAMVETALPPLPARMDAGGDLLLALPDGTFLVRGRFSGMRFVARIRAERDGELVTLRASWIPLPLSAVPMVLALAPTALALARSGARGAELRGLAAGLVIGLPIGLAIAFARARSRCLDGCDHAMERIEHEALAAAQGDARGERP